MARIAREQHSAIRRRIDEGGEKVAAVAAAYGCTPANIYAILAKLRREDGKDATAPAPAVESAEPAALFAAPEADAAAKPNGQPAGRAAVPVAAPAPSESRPAPPAAPLQEERTATSAKAPPRAPKLQAQTQPRRSGYALLMRTSDGEEAVNPFRSLDELLSAAKPILRTAARSPEPVWFSIQQVDLDTLDDLS